MTWYANNVYTRRSDSLEEALCREFPNSVYRVKDLRDQEWWKPEIKHGLPEGGLLALRPVAGGEPDDHLHSWYEEEVISWHDFEGFSDSDRELRVPPIVLKSADCEDDVIPNEGFLRFLRHLSCTHKMPVVYYQSFMWGGETEEEFAFVYNGENESLYLYAGIVDDNPQMEIRENSTTPRTVIGDVLIYALTHIGLKLPSRFFAPHTRSFDWRCHRLH